MGQIAKDGSCYGTVPRAQVERLRDKLTAAALEAKAEQRDVIYMRVNNAYMGEAEHRIAIRAGGFSAELQMTLDCD